MWGPIKEGLMVYMPRQRRHHEHTKKLQHTRTQSTGMLSDNNKLRYHRYKGSYHAQNVHQTNTIVPHFGWTNETNAALTSKYKQRVLSYTKKSCAESYTNCSLL